MTFAIENLGKVHKAELRLDGITVIAGANGSGKSTVGKTLMTWCSVIRRMPDLILDERMKSVRDEVNGILKESEVSAFEFFTCRDQDANLAMLKPEAWADVSSVSRHMHRSWHSMFMQSSVVDELAAKVVSLQDRIVPAVRSVMARDGAEYVQTILEDCFNTAFGDEHRALVSGSGKGIVASVSEQGRSRRVEFEGNAVASYSGVLSNHAPRAFYLEPVHLLDLYACTMSPKGGGPWRMLPDTKYHAEDVDWRQFLARDADTSTWSLERKNKQKEIALELDRIVSVIHGSVMRAGVELRFKDTDAKADVPMLNAASGAKSMGLIEKGVRDGIIEPGSLLIIDEPESNLHPEWQLEFARFLVRLNASFDIKILINTHSPYFLRAINVFVRDLSLTGRARYYNMVPTADGGGEFETKDVTENVEELFAAMYRPFEALF